MVKGSQRMGVYICRCGGNIDNSLDTKRLHDAAVELENVVHVSTVDYACSPGARDAMAADAKKHNIDRVLIAACSPKLYLSEFHKVLEPTGVQGCMVEMCNIREQCAWVHHGNIKGASIKAEDMLRMSHDRLMMQSEVEKVNVSQVNKMRCIGCGICESVCNFNAIRVSPDKEFAGARKANVNVNACEGCGACVAACPTSALDQACFSNAQVLSQIEAYIKGTKMDSPKVVVFSCHWCSYTAADLAGLKRMAMDPNFVVIRTMCSARVDPEWVIKAMSLGVDGVLVLAGHPGRCHYEIGNLRTRKRMTLLHNYLDQVGFHPDRFQISYIDSEETESYVRTINEYVQKIREIGPNPIDPSTNIMPKRLEMPWLDIKPPKRWDEGLDV